MRVLDLQGAFPGTRPPSEDFKYEAGTIDDLGAPRLLQIALLHRRQRTVHYHDASVMSFDDAGNLFDLAFTEIRRRAQRVERHDAGLLDLEIDGARKPDRFVELGFRRAIGTRRGAAQHRLD